MFKYPYKAKSPVTKEVTSFDSKSDVLSQIELIYDEAIEQSVMVGHSLYHQIPFFASDQNLFDTRTQSAIKGMRYCKISNTSPYPTLEKTPINYLNKFLWFNQEYDSIINTEQNK